MARTTTVKNTAAQILGFDLIKSMTLSAGSEFPPPLFKPPILRAIWIWSVYDEFTSRTDP
jgi:hypothetical protein